MNNTTNRFTILKKIRKFVGINLEYVKIVDWNDSRNNKTFFNMNELAAKLFDLSMKKNIVNILGGDGPSCRATMRIVVSDPVHEGRTNIDTEVMDAISRLELQEG